jgi:hypothetical protein
MRLSDVSHSAARSRLVKISSHDASRPIGLPHSKSDFVPPVVESGFAEAGGAACSAALRVSWEGGSGGEVITLLGSISREASFELSAPVTGAVLVAVVVSCDRGRGRGASVLTGPNRRASSLESSACVTLGSADVANQHFSPTCSGSRRVQTARDPGCAAKTDSADERHSAWADDAMAMEAVRIRGTRWGTRMVLLQWPKR